MARGGARPITAAELDAHLSPIRQDVRQLVRDQREFAEFMTGAVSSRALQENIRSSRHFWIGVAVSLAAISVTTVGLLIGLHG